MSLKEHKFKNLLYDILGDINNHLDVSREEVLSNCINKKLLAIKNNYSKQLDNLYKYILSRSNIKTIKAINKVKKG